MTQKSFEESFQRARMAALGYEAAKKEAEALEAAMTEIEKVMKEFPRGPMGLPLESVRVTPEYRAAKNESTRRWERLRAFNEIFVKVFEKEIKKERAEITRARQSRR